MINAHVGLESLRLNPLGLQLLDELCSVVCSGVVMHGNRAAESSKSQAGGFANSTCCPRYEGEVLRNAELGDALELLAADGPEPFYRGDIAVAVCEWLRARGGWLAPADLAGYRAVALSLRGHGTSPRTKPLRSCSIADYLDDVVPRLTTWVAGRCSSAIPWAA